MTGAPCLPGRRSGLREGAGLRERRRRARRRDGEVPPVARRRREARPRRGNRDAVDGGVARDGYIGKGGGIARDVELVEATFGGGPLQIGARGGGERDRIRAGPALPRENRTADADRGRHRGVPA